jgi:PilZ domain
LGLATSAYRRVAPARIEQREATRHPVVIKRATVRGHGRQPVESRLVDVSIYGCRLAVDTAFAPGERLWLRIAGGNPIAATTIWIDGDHLGCRFDEPLDRALLRALTLVIN